MKNILIFRLGFLGDSLIAVPAIREIIRLHPEGTLHLLTRATPPSNQASAKNVLGRFFDFRTVLEYKPGMGIGGWLELASRIRGLQVDHVYYLAPLRESRLQRVRDWVFFRIMCGIRSGTGFADAGQGGGPKCQRELDRLYALVSGGRPYPGAPLRFPASEEEEGRVLSLLGWEPRMGGERLIGVCAGSKMPAKRWPESNYMRVLERLVQEPGLRIVLVGDAQDQPSAARIADQLGDRCVDATGRLSIPESAFLLSLCSAYLGNDTGAMHLAALAGTPCLALFSSRDQPGKWDPAGSGNLVLRKELPCSGCMLEVCPRDNECLAAISCDEVLDACERMGILEKAPSSD